MAVVRQLGGDRAANASDSLLGDEDWLFTRLRQLKCLLVLDHIEELQVSIGVRT